METKQKETNQVTCFMLYVFNDYNLHESVKIFGANLGMHIYTKRKNYLEQGRDNLYWYAQLDDKCRAMLVKRAVEKYG